VHKHNPLQVGETVDINEEDVWWWAVVTEMLPNGVRVSRLGEHYDVLAPKQDGAWL